MHLILANQMHEKIYKKLSKFTPTTSSTSFMSTAVQTAEKFKLTNTEGKTRHKNDRKDDRKETLFHVKQDQKCFSCQKSGHNARNCPTQQNCRYCKKTGHSAKDCRTRIAKGITFCDKCHKIGHTNETCKAAIKCTKCNKNGHHAQECRKTRTDSQTKTPQSKGKDRVRLLEDPNLNCEISDSDSDNSEVYQ